MSYSFNPGKTLEKSMPVVEQTRWTEDSMKTWFAIHKPVSIEGIYENAETDTATYYKLGIVKKSENKFHVVVLASGLKYWLPGELKAVLEQGEDEYHYNAEWRLGYKTLTKVPVLRKDNFLSIDFSSSGKEKIHRRFVKIFPKEK